MESVTQRESLKALQPKINSMEKRILEEITSMPATCAELEEGLNLSHQTVSGRLRSLVLQGRIEWSGKVRTNPKSGRLQSIYTASNNYLNPDFRPKISKLDEVRIIVGDRSLTNDIKIQRIKEVL